MVIALLILVFAVLASAVAAMWWFARRAEDDMNFDQTEGMAKPDDGLRLGIAICEDFWHLASPQLLALDGAQVLINVSSSPGRDVAVGSTEGLGTATSWRGLIRTYAQLTTSYVVFVNRVGVDESISFWGGSEVVGPSGASVYRAPLHEEGLFLAEIDPLELRRERITTPLLRDERPEVVLRQLDRIARARAGEPEEDGGVA